MTRHRRSGQNSSLRPPTPRGGEPDKVAGPSPWIGVSTGILGAVCGLASLSLATLLYVQGQPKFIIDIPSDFAPAPVSSGKNGIPIGDYDPNPRTGKLTVPCDIINTGEKSEVIRFVTAELFMGRQFVGKFEDRAPITVGGKQVSHLDI